MQPCEPALCKQDRTNLPTLVQIPLQKGYEVEDSTMQIRLHQPRVQVGVFLCQSPYRFLKSGLTQTEPLWLWLLTAMPTWCQQRFLLSQAGSAVWMGNFMNRGAWNASFSSYKIWDRSPRSSVCMFWKWKMDIKPHFRHPRKQPEPQKCWATSPNGGNMVSAD